MSNQINYWFPNSGRLYSTAAFSSTVTFTLPPNTHTHHIRQVVVSSPVFDVQSSTRLRHMLDDRSHCQRGSRSGGGESGEGAERERWTRSGRPSNGWKQRVEATGGMGRIAENVKGLRILKHEFSTVNGRKHYCDMNITQVRSPAKYQSEQQKPSKTSD